MEFDTTSFWKFTTTLGRKLSEGRLFCTKLFLTVYIDRVISKCLLRSDAGESLYTRCSRQWAAVRGEEAEAWGTYASRPGYRRLERDRHGLQDDAPVPGGGQLGGVESGRPGPRQRHPPGTGMTDKLK